MRSTFFFLETDERLGRGMKNWKSTVWEVLERTVHIKTKGFFFFVVVLSNPPTPVTSSSSPFPLSLPRFHINFHVYTHREILRTKKLGRGRSSWKSTVWEVLGRT
ncbi:hypothetical protein ACOSQ2_020020 [Xanthoceras sorbifolium]